LPALAIEDVIAGLTKQKIRAGAAGQNVIARAAKQLRRWQRTIGFVERDRVIAVQAEHLNFAGVSGRRLTAVDRDRTVVDENVPSRIAAPFR
jgi:hypothetical protein